MKIIILGSLFFYIIKNDAVPLQGKVINGIKITNECSRYFAAVRWYEDDSLNICTGGIISYKHILTAAHCVYKLSLLPVAQIGCTGFVQVGNDYLPSTKPYFMRRVNVPKRFNPQDQLSAIDIAVITLCERMLLSDVNLFTLPTNKDILGDVFAVGWGTPSPDHPENLTDEQLVYWTQYVRFQLNMIGFTVNKNKICEHYYNVTLSKAHICLIPTCENHGIFNGDSGGPIFLGSTILAVLINGIPVVGTPVVAQKVFSHLKYIERAMGYNKIKTKLTSANEYEYIPLNKNFYDFYSASIV